MNTQNKKYNLSLYWKCQLIGWSIFSIYCAYTVYTRDSYGVFYTLLNYALDISIGIFLTHIYREFALKANWSSLPIKQLLIRVISSILLLAIVYVFISNIKWYIFWIVIVDKNVSFLESIIYWDPILLKGLRLISIWILAYHLYHYYQKEVVTAKENAKLSLIAKQNIENIKDAKTPLKITFTGQSSISLPIWNPIK